MITKECRALFRRYMQGERGLTYPDGLTSFKPFHFISGILSAQHFDKMKNGHKHYYTSGRNGKALVYIDHDEHYKFQSDAQKACDLLTAFLGEGNLFTAQSARGINQYLKIDYGTSRWQTVNRAFLGFGNAANRYCKAHGILADVETKGTIQTSDTDYGSLAKLPVNRDWTFATLDQFQATPEKALAWLNGATAALIEATDQQVADRQIAISEQHKRKEKGNDLQDIGCGQAGESVQGQAESRSSGAAQETADSGDSNGGKCVVGTGGNDSGRPGHIFCIQTVRDEVKRVRELRIRGKLLAGSTSDCCELASNLL